ncbi:MAG: helix-turn-helix domain-containing protein [Candidatus Hodarchaeota archaeon]
MKQLKKIVLKVPLDSQSRKFFDLLEKYELLQIHRQDDDQIFATQKVKFKDPKMHPKMLEGKHYGMPYIEVINEDRGKNEYIFFSKHNMVKETKEFLDKLDLIIDPPIILDKDRLLVSVITDSKRIDELVGSLNFFYNTKLEILSISDIQPNYENLFLKLTDRQKEIVYYAIQQGYFEIPRKINSKKIANHFKISRSALYEHLRKIERIIYHTIFS